MTKDWPSYLDLPRGSKPPTNADRIRSMTDEEISKLLESVGVDQGIYDMFCSNPKRQRLCDSHCDKCIFDWLQQPAETEGKE